MTSDVIVVGGGVGGLTAAALLAHRGLRVRLVEAGSRLGGKAGTTYVDGVPLDTGPSVLTLPHVIEAVFDEVGLPKSERFEVIELSPSFRYVFPSGAEVLFHHELGETFASVESSLGARARAELEDYLSYSRQIWEAAAPHFVMGPAPEVSRLLRGGPRIWGAVRQIDALRTLRSAIKSRVKTPELVSILERYATYNGSDARTAPATLGCIAHVELGLGGFGVRGGLRAIVRALERALERTGVLVELDTNVTELLFAGRKVRGVETTRGTFLAESVVLGADLAQWQGSFPSGKVPGSGETASMSGYNAIFLRSKAPDPMPRLAPHTVFFPENYEKEFADIFDEGRVPEEPTIYVCAQDRCHKTQSFPDREPLFTMVNAPALSSSRSLPGAEAIAERIRERLVTAKLLSAEDELVWSRSPSDLAREFPGSGGALYGPASNSMMSAFRRVPNRLPDCDGLYVASGSAHPGGGVPLAVQSGRLAADCVIQERTTG